MGLRMSQSSDVAWSPTVRYGMQSGAMCLQPTFWLRTNPKYVEKINNLQYGATIEVPIEIIYASTEIYQIHSITPKKRALFPGCLVATNISFQGLSKKITS